MVVALEEEAKVLEERDRHNPSLGKRDMAHHNDVTGGTADKSFFSGEKKSSFLILPILWNTVRR